jgi:DNA/RNA endonuclease G (NUC1)
MATIRDLAFAKESLLSCDGFNPLFITNRTSISLDKTLPNVLKQALPDVEGNRKKILNYTNLSVLYHADRRVPFLSAYNIDGGKKISGIKRASSF